MLLEAKNQEKDFLLELTQIINAETLKAQFLQAYKYLSEKKFIYSLDMQFNVNVFTNRL